MIRCLVYRIIFLLVINNKPNIVDNCNNFQAKKEARRKEMEHSKSEIIKQFPDDLLYGLTTQSLFVRIRDQSINNFDNYR